MSHDKERRKMPLAFLPTNYSRRSRSRTDRQTSRVVDSSFLGSNIKKNHST